MSNKLFPVSVSEADEKALKATAAECRAAILSMTTLAASGHPGGSMSSIDILLTLYRYADISPANINDYARDKVIASIGHISPAVYSTLAVNGFFPMDDAISQFRLAGSLYEGHIERSVVGVEWTTGNLGQGLSAACGMALAAKIKGENSYVYVIMGDGEQQKGQLTEAKRFATKYNLSNIIAFIDANNLQICGKTCDVMPQSFIDEYSATGWNVLTADGHDYNSIVAAVNKAQQSDKPTVIIASTTMGKGVSFMENKHKYHGSPLSEDDYKKAIVELGLTPDLDRYKALRKTFTGAEHKLPNRDVLVNPIPAHIYKADEKTDCRSAAGLVMTAMAESSVTGNNKGVPFVAFDCDLAGSIKTADIEKNFPERFIQCGISEHNAATVASAASVCGIVPFFTTFTMFAVVEVYNQLRMADINGTNMKVISTHAGVDVGEDGRTHQCIDYLGLMRNLFSFQVITPADPNQTDAAVRYAAVHQGNVAVIMGRSKVPTITAEDGKPLFGEGYQFQYGKIDEVRKGKIPLLSYGGMLYRALKVKELVPELGVYNVSTPTTPNREEIIELAKAGVIFTYEDHNPYSGLYASVCEIVASEGLACKVIPFGVTKYAYSGTPDDVFKLLGLSPEGVAAVIKKKI
ncbi:MAG: transketolase [Deferribacteraceae bacterium]|jgi:transketolase|nr:transketolase [Deferribacteraceae bacterium]